MQMPYLETDTVMQILSLPQMARSIEKYQYIVNHFPMVDVTQDKEFQRVFRDFWKMSRRYGYNDDFAAGYFELMERKKSVGTPLDFETLLQEIYPIRNTGEMSFTSKFLHIFNQHLPIWDKNVAIDHFHYYVPRTAPDKIAAYTRKYKAYSQSFMQYMESENGKMLIAAFDEVFPDLEITNTKKIDFILWKHKTTVNENICETVQKRTFSTAPIVGAKHVSPAE